MEPARKSMSNMDKINLNTGVGQGDWITPPTPQGRADDFEQRLAVGAAADRFKSLKVPLPSKRWISGFRWYGLRYISKQFHAVRLSKSGPFPGVDPERPIIIYLNHPSWWDPMIGMVAWDRYFKDRTVYTPIDSEALEKYRFFKKLGFFGVEAGTSKGARQFLRSAKEILQPDRRSILMVTPQGRMADVRERPLGFLPGLAALISRTPEVTVIPMAVEYTFWDERRPEALIQFGEPVETESSQISSQGLKQISSLLEERLGSVMDSLHLLSITRDPDRFETLLDGASGVSIVYDTWRRFRAWLRGESFKADHSS